MCKHVSRYLGTVLFIERDVFSIYTVSVYSVTDTLFTVCLQDFKRFIAIKNKSEEKLQHKIEVVDLQKRRKKKSIFPVNMRYTLRVHFLIILLLVYIICGISFLHSEKNVSTLSCSSENSADLENLRGCCQIKK